MSFRMCRKKLKRWWKLGLASVLLTVAGSSCGIFGNKKESSKTAQSSQDLGCLDSLSPKFGRYLDGKIEEKEWVGIFDCVVEQVNFFKEYVAGADARGYTQADIAFLIRTYLVKAKPVSNAFVKSIFEIKAGVFGGDADVLTKADLDRFNQFMLFLKGETVALLKPLQNHRLSPSSRTYLELADATAVITDHLANYLTPRIGAYSIAKESFIPFAKEMMHLFDYDSRKVDEYEELVRSVKVLLADGSKDAIEAWAWPKIFREAGAFAGLYLAYQGVDELKFTDDLQRDEYYFELVIRAHQYVNRLVGSNRNAIAYNRIFQVIDALPEGALDQKLRDAVKKSFGPLIERTLTGKTPGAVDSAAVGKAFELVEAGLRGQIWAKRIFKNLRATTTAEAFQREAFRQIERSSSPQDKQAIVELIKVAKDFIGLYTEDDSVMKFTRETTRTRTVRQIVNMNWYRKLMRHIFKQYATGPDHVATVDDLTRLSTDFGEILKAIGKFAPDITYESVAAKRFREANLFMPNSNGDEYVSEDESVYYIAVLVSSGTMTGRIWDKITDTGRLCPIVGTDEMGNAAVAVKCFREIYFGRIEEFLGRFPGLVMGYRGLNTDEQSNFIRNLEVAGRKSGESESPIGTYDIDSYSALAHYVESAVIRFDTNGDEVLDRDEILDNVYPIFKRELSKVDGAPQDELMLKGLLTYLFRFGKIPTTKSEKAHYVWWFSKRWLSGGLAWTSVQGDRFDIYNILAMISSM